MYYLGIDHHKRFSQVAVMDEKGKIRINSSMVNEKASFESLKEILKEPCKAVVEAGRNWGVMYDLLEELGIETVVAHPLKVRAIAEAKIKFDSIDASTLAHLLRANLIPPVHVPPKEIREQKNLLRHRVWLIRLQTMTENRIHQLIDRNHVKAPKVKNLFGVAGRKLLQALNLSGIDQKLLSDHLQLLDTLQEHIKKAEAWIEKELKDNPLIAVLNTLPGFGKVLSALAALEIDDINGFATKAKFASYCSLIPSTFASGGKLYHGDLIPTGNRWLKYVFIEASWVAIRTSPYCRAYFDRIKRGKGPNVAIVALARRLSEIAYRCLKGERYYVEHPYIPYTRQTPCGCPPKFLASQGL